MCLMPRFPAGIADDTKSSAGMLPVTRVGVVGNIILQPRIWLLEIVIPALVATLFDSLLLIVELVIFLCCPLHIDCGVIHVFLRGVMPYRHLLLKP